ncbi:MAG: hypothetical protein RL095_1191 [Verrucomicrobiota bacterium]|jgi:phosphonate transport system substrate-binding protein
MNIRKRFAAVLVSLVSIALGCKKAEEPAQSAAGTPPPAVAKILKFTAIPDSSSKDMKDGFEALAKTLSAELGIKVEYAPVNDYAASVSALKNKECHLAWFGGLTHVQCVKRVPGARAIAQGVEDAAFKTYLIANSSTGLSESAEFPVAIAGKSFTFGAESSTSGRLMPEFFISRHLGKKPADLFPKVGFSGSHDKTIEAVMSGAYEVGAVNFKNWDKWVKEGKADASKVKRIWTSPSYVDYNWTVHPELDQDFGAGTTDKLTKILISLKDPELLGKLKRSGFIPARNEDYESIRSTAEGLGLMDK